MGRPYSSPPSKNIQFQLGFVRRVFSSTQDIIKPKEEKSSPYQMIEISSLGDDSTMSTLQRKITARPLIRGISDSMTRGDTVLYTKVGDKHYYIGPLNNWNVPSDSHYPSYSPNLEARSIGDRTLINEDGTGKAYINKGTSKKQKHKITELDYVNNQMYDLSKSTDLILEGRYGNSIRIGHHGALPKLVIDNNSNGPIEDLEKGSIIAMTPEGSIAQNFIRDPNRFRLSSDPIPTEDTQRSFFALNEGNDGDEQTFNYQYGEVDLENTSDRPDKDQMIIFSDKITFDARANDFTVSANNNINFGTKKNFTLNNEGYSVINSNNIYLGKKAKEKTEPMVLGNELRKILVRIAEILNNARVNVQGVPMALVDPTLGPLVDISSLLEDLNSLDTQNGSMFFSKHHYIEQNDREINNEG